MPKAIPTGIYKSKLEAKAAKKLGKKWLYEGVEIPYIQTQHRKYIPDFIKGQVYIEVKGFFRPGDQRKYLAVKEQLIKDGNTEELVFVFQDPHKVIHRNGKMTMAMWATRHGFRWFSADDNLRDMI